MGSQGQLLESDELPRQHQAPGGAGASVLLEISTGMGAVAGELTVAPAFCGIQWQ